MAKPKYYPKGMSLKNNAKIKVEGELADGAFDFNDVLQGRVTRRVSADGGRDLSKPCACLFICRCNHVRRILFEVPNFVCENPSGECKIFWKMRVEPSGYDEEGNRTFKPVTCKHDGKGKCSQAELMDYPHDPGMPVIEGYDLHEIQRENRIRKGAEMAQQPQSAVADSLKAQEAEAAREDEEAPTVVADTGDDKDDYDKG